MYINSEYIKILMKFMETQGIRYENVSIPRPIREELNLEDHKIGFPVVKKILDRYFEAHYYPSLAVDYGRLLTWDAHGLPGYAVRASKNIKEILEQSIKYATLRTSIYDIQLIDCGSTHKVVYTENIDLGKYSSFFLESMLASSLACSKLFLDEDNADFQLKFAYAEPNGFETYAHKLGKNVTFHCDRHEMVFPTSVMMISNPFYDEGLSSSLRKLIDPLLDIDKIDTGVSSIVRKQIESNIFECPGVEDISSKLCVSSRTLKRRLLEEGTSFTEILNDTRKQYAIKMLKTQSLSVGGLSERMGYSSSASFIAAFKRWTGMTPSSYIRS